MIIVSRPNALAFFVPVIVQYCCCCLWTQGGEAFSNQATSNMRFNHRRGKLRGETSLNFPSCSLYGYKNGNQNSKTSTNLFGYRRDTSQTTQSLVHFLVDEECEGIGLVPDEEDAAHQEDEEEDGGVEIGFSSETGIRGLFARGDYDAGEFLCAIPFPTTLVIEDSELGGNTTDAERGLFFLQNYLQKRNESDTLSSYLGCLPTRDNSFDPTPDFFSSKELAPLEFPRLINAALQRQEDIQKVADRHNTDKDELQFATWLTKSRCFTILRLKQVDPINDPGKKTIQIRSVMIPLLDMINHSSDQPNAELEVIETKIEDESFYALQATRPIKANEEITISYGSGQDSSLDLFMNYGFVPYSNPFDIDFLRSEIQQESGSDCFTRPDKWSTTLKEDEEQLASMERAAISKSNSEDIRRRILEFRIQMKRALLEI